VPTTIPIMTLLTHRIGRMLAVAAIGTGIVVQAPAAADANPRYAAIVIDANNGKVLFDRYADEPRYPASLTKMMTLYLAFEALETGRARRSTQMKVSAYAAARPPSKLGLKAGSTISLDDAMHALVTRSANDAAVVIAEFLGGTETRFAEMMTAKARSLGMARTTFRNAHGLPNAEQRTTARDMATLGIALREHFPQYYEIFNTRSFTYRGQTIGNHNRVLTRVQGADGLKTGYINASGFNLASSVVRGNKRLVAVVMGGRTSRSRDDHMVELLNRYIPQASEGRGGPLVASWSPSSRGGSVTAHSQVASLPTSVPVPSRRAANIDTATIDARVASAYGSTAAGAVDDALRSPGGRPLLGRDALRQALNSQVEMPRMEIPTANALAPMNSAPRAPSYSNGGPVPRAPIPSVGIDRGTTGSIEPQATLQSPVAASLAVAPASTLSPWVVQIAATPAEATAMDMLGEAKMRGGEALASAEPFTETVEAGSQTLYRARFSGFATKDAANAACDALKRSAYACYTIAAN
jgi:D-alanyl-D-alanine carboxypeptidase